MSTRPQSSLVGRQRETSELDDLLLSVRSAQSGVRVLRGEAGIGKSALLAHVRAQATDVTLVQARGVEADMELAWASLHQLCLPLLGAVDDLPVPQRDALRVAFGLATGDPPDRFLVGLAVLTLLTRASETAPVVAVVDDAQWLDQISLQTLDFVARRLLAEAVGMVFAVREPEGDGLLRELPELRLTGLDPPSAGALLESVVEGHLEPPVRDRLVAETQGNPLALLELSRGRSAAELVYGEGAAELRSIPGRVEQDYARRLDALSGDTRTLLLLVAAEPVGDARLLLRAAEILGIAPDVAPARDAGLIELAEPVRFRHPLARSAVYRAASPEDRRAAHRALALATDPAGEPDRRAWHAAQAAAGPDEDVAESLERAAGRARQRGGVAAEAGLLEQAVKLTPDPARRGRRALAAAEAYFSAAAPTSAGELVTIGGLCPLGRTDQARLSRLRAQLLFAQNRSEDAAPLLLDAADRFAAEGSGLARETFLQAISTTVFAGRVHGPHGARAAAEAARTSGAPPSGSEASDLLLDGIATLLADGARDGLPALRRAVGPLIHEALDNREAVMRWLIHAPVAQEAFIHHLWDFDAWDAMATRSVGLARGIGALSMLPLALVFQAGVDFHRGDVVTALARIAESDAVCASTGNAPLRYASLVLTAWLGDEPATVEVLDGAARSAVTHGEASLLGVSGYAQGVLYNGLGRFDLALAGARQGIDHDGFNFVGWALAEHIEAAVYCGERAQAEDSLRRLAELTGAAGTDWALGIRSRCAALLSTGDEADRLFREARDLLDREGIAVQVARTYLLHGEALRREGDRTRAREHLWEAYRRFESLRLLAFAERARREIGAAGGRARPPRNASRSTTSLTLSCSPTSSRASPRAWRSI